MPPSDDLSGRTESHELAVGTVLEGKYRIEGRVGQGGMGAVYAATHQRLDKKVAIKVLLPALARRPEMVKRMIVEARAASATGHPNIVAVTDMGDHEGLPFFVMELLEGESLADRLRRARLPASEAVSLMCQVLDALSAVHTKGILHRDLKPANVMVVPGPEGRPVAKILDFGISKVSGDEAGVDVKTKTGAVLGTPSFMSPEQAMASDLDERTDLHSVASMLYALVVGLPPFHGPNPTATIARILDGSFDPPSARVPGVPTALDDVLRRALAVDREERYPDAKAMREDLENVFSRDSPSIGPPVLEEEIPGLEDPQVEGVASAGSATEVAHPPPRSASWPSAGPPSSRLRVQPLADVTSTGAPDNPAKSGLELDVPDGWKPGGSESSDPVPRPPGSRRSVLLGWYALVAFVGIGVAAAWFFRDELGATVEGAAEAVEGGSHETVLILIDTKPKGAIIYVDGVQRDERPIEMQKSKASIEVRVQARGYAPRTIQLVPSRTRRLDVTLDRAR